tara:strand:+ start:66 stop:350 length:285 start_codon:yes stop_codon:yes gene_type:complete
MKSLINSVTSIAKKLNKDGFETEINPVYLGSYQGSYVELTLEKVIGDEDYYTSVKFIANGYTGFSKTEFGTELGLKVAKKKFLDYLQEDIKVYL